MRFRFSSLSFVCAGMLMREEGGSRTTLGGSNDGDDGIAGADGRSRAPAKDKRHRLYPYRGKRRWCRFSDFPTPSQNPRPELKTENQCQGRVVGNTARRRECRKNKTL